MGLAITRVSPRARLEIPAAYPESEPPAEHPSALARIFLPRSAEAGSSPPKAPRSGRRECAEALPRRALRDAHQGERYAAKLRMKGRAALRRTILETLCELSSLRSASTLGSSPRLDPLEGQESHKNLQALYNIGGGGFGAAGYILGAVVLGRPRPS